MDKVIETIEPYVQKADDMIAKYPSLTQYGMSLFKCTTGISTRDSREAEEIRRVKEATHDHRYINMRNSRKESHGPWQTSDGCTFDGSPVKYPGTTCFYENRRRGFRMILSK